MDEATIGLLLSVIGSVIGLLAFWKAVDEYRRQGTIKRIEFFLESRNRLKTNAKFQEICRLLESDDPALRDTPMQDKIDFIGFFEEIALLVNSRVIRAEVAQYMFGYYALRCWDSVNFWQLADRPERPLNKEEEPYWFVFRSFIRQMLPMRETLLAGRSKATKYSL